MFYVLWLQKVDTKQKQQKKKQKRVNDLDNLHDILKRESCLVLTHSDR